jgi:hypothetical protein
MAKATAVNLDDLRKKRESLEAEIVKIRDQEIEQAERTLKEHAEVLLKEIRRLGYGAWAYEGKDGLFIRIGKKRASGGDNGHEVTITKEGKAIGTFSSATKAAEHLKLDTGKDSAVRVLERYGYTIEKK